MLRQVEFADTFSGISAPPHFVCHRVLVRKIESNVDGWIGSVILNAAHIRQTMCKPLKRPGRVRSWDRAKQVLPHF